jgi:hypothetical protein
MNMSELLEARAAIADLVHTYALHIRHANGAECVNLFTANGVFEVREARLDRPGIARTRAKLTGHEEIKSYLARTAASETRVCPVISNLIIQVSGVEASSTCVMTSLVWSTGQQIVGEYADSYRYDNGWRFDSRVFTILGEFSYVSPLR